MYEMCFSFSIRVSSHSICVADINRFHVNDDDDDDFQSFPEIPASWRSCLIRVQFVFSIRPITWHSSFAFINGFFFFFFFIHPSVYKCMCICGGDISSGQSRHWRCCCCCCCRRRCWCPRSVEAGPMMQMTMMLASRPVEVVGTDHGEIEEFWLILTVGFFI